MCGPQSWTSFCRKLASIAADGVLPWASALATNSCFAARSSSSGVGAVGIISRHETRVVTVEVWNLAIEMTVAKECCQWRSWRRTFSSRETALRSQPFETSSNYTGHARPEHAPHILDILDHCKKAVSYKHELPQASTLALASANSASVMAPDLCRSVSFASSLATPPPSLTISP